MYNSVKTMLAFLLCVVFTNAVAQITVDPTVRNRYDSAYKRLPANVRRNIQRSFKPPKQFSTKEIDGLNSPSFAVVTLHQVDTLNKSQLKGNRYFGHVEKYQIMVCEAAFASDTLGIVLYAGIGLDSKISIAHLIVHDTVKSEYEQWEEYDTSFRTDLHMPKTNDVTVSFVNIKFVLSDKRFVDGKTIYGFADIISEPYYQDDEKFSSGYISKRLHFRYYFKFVVEKNQLGTLLPAG